MAYETATKVLAGGGVTLGSVREETASNWFTRLLAGVGLVVAGCWPEASHSWCHVGQAIP